MTEERLRVESGPPQHIVADSDLDATQSGSVGAGAKEKAQDVAANAKATVTDVAGKAREMAAPAKETAQGIAGQAKHHAHAAAGQAKDKAAEQVDERSTRVGQQIGAQGEALDGVAEELRRQGKDGPAKLVAQAGEKVKDVGSYLEDIDGESLIATATDVARENPAAAAAAGAAAGFVAGRVIKASQPDDETSGDEPSSEHSAEGITR